MSRHVRAEKLARFRDGDLGAAAARRVSAHLAGCAACQADAEALAGLPALLAATELPPIPDHLAARIETALATESAHRAAGSPALDPGQLDRPAQPARPARPAHSARPAAAGHRGASRRSGVPRLAGTDEHGQRHTRRSRPARRILAAAAVVVVLGGGYALVSNLSNGSGSNTSASSSSGSRAAASPAEAPEARPRSSEFAPAVPGANAGVAHGVAGAPDLGPVQQYRADGQAGSFTPVRTSTAYAAARLGQQATAALAEVRDARPAQSGHTSGPTSGRVSGDSGAGAFSAATLARLRGCVPRVAAGQSVLLVDLASFEGSPATIIVTAPPGSATASQVWAVGPGCSSSAADVLAHHQLP